jgi:hypothetical protein
VTLADHSRTGAVRPETVLDAGDDGLGSGALGARENGWWTRRSVGRGVGQWGWGSEETHLAPLACYGATENVRP